VADPDNHAAGRFIGLAAITFVGAVTLAGGIDSSRSQPAATLCVRTAGLGANQCVSCHRIRAVLSHPVDVVPSMVVPAHLPLADGRMTCMTCHGVNDTGQAEVPGVATVESTFCGQCHDPLGSSRADMHANAGSRAHLSWSDGMRREGIGPSLATWGPDPESRSCLTCHDGSLASGAGLLQASAFSPGQMAARLLANHPIGGEQRPRGRGDSLLPPERLDPRVRLFDGRVGCGSCHSLYADHDSLLVISNQSSRLCLNCHDF
jgi:hypothetical protein